MEKRTHHIAIGLEREISDEEEEEDEESEYEYETEEDDIITEYDREYIEYQAAQEAAKADPFNPDDEFELPTLNKSCVSGSRHYD